MKTFWLVWCPQGGPPTFRHESEGAARAEAERLAQNFGDGRQFFVLKAVALVEKKSIFWTEIDDKNEVPF